MHSGLASASLKLCEMRPTRGGGGGTELEGVREECAVGRRLAHPGGLIRPCELPGSCWSRHCWTGFSWKLLENCRAGCDLIALYLPSQLVGFSAPASQILASSSSRFFTLGLTVTFSLTCLPRLWKWRGLRKTRLTVPLRNQLTPHSGPSLLEAFLSGRNSVKRAYISLAWWYHSGS